MEIFMGDRNYLLVKIPPLVWNGFKRIRTEEAIVANCATMSHQANEIQRLGPFPKQIPYD